MNDINQLGQTLADKLAFVIDSYVNEELKDLELEGFEKDDIVIRACVGILMASISHAPVDDMQNIAFSIIANLSNNVGMLVSKMVQDFEKLQDDENTPEQSIN